MQSQLPIPAWSQRDPRWARQRLGTADGTTIGGQGCLITSISMMNAGFDPDHVLTPNQVDDLFTDNAGYANRNLVIWNKINQLLANCSTQGQIFCQNSPAPVGDLKAHLDAGHLAILQVGFGGNPANMHFVLALGYNGDDIVFNDPWYGDRASFQSGRYGNGQSSHDILAIHYFADGVPPVKPEVPVAKPAAEQPVLGFQRTVKAGFNVNYRKTADPNGELIKLFKAGDVLDFKGFVHGANVDGDDVWFVGKYSGGFAISSAFTDPDTHDLPDLTPQPDPPAPAPEPTPEPAPEVPVEPVIPDPEPTSPPVETPVESVEKEWEQTWTPDTTIPQKIVTSPQGANVVDVTTGNVVKTIPQNELIAPLGGHFRTGGVHYVRTQSAVDNGWWNGISVENLGDFVPNQPEPATSEDEEELGDDLPQAPIPGTVVQPSRPPINPGAPVDSIQPPASSGSIFDDPQFEDPFADLENHDEPRIPLSEVLESIRHAALGLVLSPLRLIGWIGKLIKGVQLWKS